MAGRAVGRRGMVRLGLRLVAATAIAVSLAACDGASLPVALGPQGQAIDPGAPPDPAACAARIRAEVGEAARIRTELTIPGIPPDEAAVEAAATDPAADLFTLGIPLTGPELEALRDSGMALEPTTPITTWANTTSTTHFGGVWIDPPGSDRYVVSVVGGDQGWVDLAQCLAGGADVRYVTARRSLADGTALLDRASNDLDELRRMGIQVNVMDWDEVEGRLVFGVGSSLDQALLELRRRYGPDVWVEAAGPVVPD